MALSPVEIDKLKDEILKISDQPKQFYELAIGLRKLQSESAIEFRTFIEAAPFSKSRAYQLVRIAEFYEPLNIPTEELEAVGFTKLLLLADEEQIDAHSVEFIMSFVKNHTVKELHDYIADMAMTAKKRVFTLHLTTAEYDLYRQVLISYGAEPHGKGLRCQEKALMKLVKAAAATK